MSFQIENMKPDDWEQVSAIFAESLKTRVASFDSEVPSWEKWDSSRLAIGRLVARKGNEILGWASLSAAAST